MLDQKTVFLKSGEKVIKRPGPMYKDIKTNYGGNRRWQTFKFCIQCGTEFGPVDRISKRLCSSVCKIKKQTTGRKRKSFATKKARAAQSKLAYAVLTGRLIRSNKCQDCGEIKERIEGAHYNYDDPLRVKWLCVSCHRIWDKKNPKGGFYSRRIKK